jgi:hypothetical protein
VTILDFAFTLDFTRTLDFSLVSTLVPSFELEMDFKLNSTTVLSIDSSDLEMIRELILVFILDSSDLEMIRELILVFILDSSDLEMIRELILVFILDFVSDSFLDLEIELILDLELRCHIYYCGQTSRYKATHPQFLV